MIKLILVELDLTAATAGNFHRVCSAAHDVIYDGNVYSAAGQLLQVDDLQNMIDMANIGTTVTLSGIDPAYRQEIDNNGFKRAPITIIAADLPDDTDEVVNAVIVHAGTCDTPVTEVDYGSDTITIGISTVSIWGELDKSPNLTRSSFATHSAIHCYDENGEYSPDETFKYVASTSSEEQWVT